MDVKKLKAIKTRFKQIIQNFHGLHSLTGILLGSWENVLPKFELTIAEQNFHEKCYNLNCFLVDPNID